MAVFNRKIGRLVAVRGITSISGGPKYVLWPARITAVGAITDVNVQILHKDGVSMLGVSRWLRSSPNSMGWVRV